MSCGRCCTRVPRATHVETEAEMDAQLERIAEAVL
jgi:hypothetical protein